MKIKHILGHQVSQDLKEFLGVTLCWYLHNSPECTNKAQGLAVKQKADYISNRVFALMILCVNWLCPLVLPREFLLIFQI